MDLGNYDMIASVSGERVAGQRSFACGQDKRHAKSQMPRIVFAYSSKSKDIMGCFRLDQCMSVRSDCLKNVHLVCSCYVPLLSAVQVTADMCKYRSQAFLVNSSVEASLRQTVVAGGLPMNHHFPGQHDRRWHCVSLSDEHVEALARSQGGVLLLECKHNYSRALCIVPEHVDSLPSLEADLEAADGGPDLDDAAPAAQPAAFDPVSSARSCLGHISKEYGDGSRVRHEAEGTLNCLLFADNLKPGVSMGGALADAAPMFLGRTSAVGELQDDLRQERVRVPSLRWLVTCRLKLDLLSMLWQRFLQTMFVFIRYIMMDASPQLGADYFIVREDRVRIPLQDHGPAFRAAYNINDFYEERIMPLSTLGLGRSGGAKKSINTANNYLMESEDDVHFHTTRNEVKGAVTDQGQIVPQIGPVLLRIP